jgi:phosphoribosylanthranilate isomerase
MTWIKICGTTNLEDALTAVDAGADAVGFVFYEKSPRNISVEGAKEIVEKLPEVVEKVGVFVGEMPEKVREILKEASLSLAQIYPDFETPLSIPSDRFLETLQSRVIVALSASQLKHQKSGDPDVLMGFRVSHGFRDRIAAVLVDSGAADRPGGTGKKFDWHCAAPITNLMNRIGLKFIVAGGLTPAIVEDAMRALRPWGVDVVSGVEASPGKKDPDKVRAFVKAVRDFDRKSS